jgi:hypothetical protein
VKELAGRGNAVHSCDEQLVVVRTSQFDVLPDEIDGASAVTKVTISKEVEVLVKDARALQRVAMLCSPLVLKAVEIVADVHEPWFTGDHRGRPGGIAFAAFGTLWHAVVVNASSQTAIRIERQCYRPQVVDDTLYCPLSGWLKLYQAH